MSLALEVSHRNGRTNVRYGSVTLCRGCIRGLRQAHTLLQRSESGIHCGMIEEVHASEVTVVRGLDSINLRVELFGEPAGTRTQGPRLKRAMLYRLSYRLTA